MALSGKLMKEMSETGKCLHLILELAEADTWS